MNAQPSLASATDRFKEDPANKREWCRSNLDAQGGNLGSRAMFELGSRNSTTSQICHKQRLMATTCDSQHQASPLAPTNIDPIATLFWTVIIRRLPGRVDNECNDAAHFT
jgi:hypothetical protein